MGTPGEWKFRGLAARGHGDRQDILAPVPVGCGLAGSRELRYRSYLVSIHGGNLGGFQARDVSNSSFPQIIWHKCAKRDK